MVSFENPYAALKICLLSVVLVGLLINRVDCGLFSYLHKKSFNIKRALVMRNWIAMRQAFWKVINYLLIFASNLFETHNDLNIQSFTFLMEVVKEKRGPFSRPLLRGGRRKCERHTRLFTNHVLLEYSSMILDPQNML